MRDFHIDPAEAVEILEIVGARQGLAIHWRVFPLSDEGRDEPAVLLARVLAERGIAPGRFEAPEPGHVFDLQRRSAPASPLDVGAIAPI